ncbi:transposase [Patescibacteria group bacterium]|nr:transposase [Patescibacteria group bacterium]
MPRKIIPLITGDIYHVYNRGVDKREIFLDKEDYLRFYISLDFFNVIEPVINFDSAKVRKDRNLKEDKLVEILAYSLLPNHFHLILQQNVDRGISEFMKRISGGYTSYFNSKLERSGSLLQGTFKKVPVQSQEQLQYLMAYVNENHFVHGIEIKREICHSSSLHYQGLNKSKIINQSNEKYNFESNVLLAKDIYQKRRSLKYSDLMEN